jgi:hypothetical protein
MVHRKFLERETKQDNVEGDCRKGNEMKKQEEQPRTGQTAQAANDWQLQIND